MIFCAVQQWCKICHSQCRKKYKTKLTQMHWKWVRSLVSGLVANIKLPKPTRRRQFAARLAIYRIYKCYISIKAIWTYSQLVHRSIKRSLPPGSCNRRKLQAEPEHCQKNKENKKAKSKTKQTLNTCVYIVRYISWDY